VEKIDILDVIKILKVFCASKDTVKKKNNSEDNPQNGKIFLNHVSNKVLVFKKKRNSLTTQY
jgi:hypothetical protein